MKKRAVFAGCARSCAAHLPKVLQNLENWAAQYDEVAFVIVENDSEDETKTILREWLKQRENGTLIELDGLAESQPKRTERIATARNVYMDFIRESRFADYDDLVALDFDEVNSAPSDMAGFLIARDFLWAHEDVVGVFANARPFYYDVWALRHPEWSPDDCWERVAKEMATLGASEARKRFVFDRQISIRPDSPPIFVDSAFGGLGIYKLSACHGVRYVGRAADGRPMCEHVNFSLALRGAGGQLVVHPRLMNRTSSEHVKGALDGFKEIKLEQNDRSCILYAPAHHELETYRKAHPLYDRRLPQLAALLTRDAGEGAIVDVGANIGDTIALCRLAGCSLPVIAIEASLTYCKYLWANVLTRREVFGEVGLVWGFVGSADANVSMNLSAGTATVANKPAPSATVESVPTVALADAVKRTPVALVKTDTDGHDHEVLQHEMDFLRSRQPIVWAEAQTESEADEQAWLDLLKAMSDTWTRVVVFDNFGFAVWAGELGSSIESIGRLMAYARRQRALAPRGFGQPTLYYLDIALFPVRLMEAYENFTAKLLELRA